LDSSQNCASTTPYKLIGKKGVEKLIEVIKFKARLVACGFSEVFGLHYNNNNSPTACYRSITVLLCIAAIYAWDKDVHMYLPLDWTNGKKILVKLNKNLYGLKQAGLFWYLLL
jgi:hypothetical protein